MTAGDDLVRRMAVGDREALLEFYDRTAPEVWPPALALLGDVDEAAAVLHDAFWDAWQLAGSDDREASPEIWILALVRRRAGERAPARGRERSIAAAEADSRREVASPPVAIRDGLRARLAATRPRRPPIASRATWLRWGAATAGVALAVGALTAGYVAARYEARIGELSREAARIRERLRQERGSLLAESAIPALVVELLRDPAARVVGLAPPGRAGRASGRIVWSDAVGGVLVTADLPSPPRGETYEVWMMVENRARHVGTLAVDGAGRGGVRLAPTPDASTPTGFVVTVEAHVGATPAGPTVLAAP